MKKPLKRDLFVGLALFFVSISANKNTPQMNENIPTNIMTTEWLKIEPAKENVIGYYKEIIETLKQNRIESLRIHCPKSHTLELIRALFLEKTHETGDFGTLEQISYEAPDHNILYIKLNI